MDPGIVFVSFMDPNILLFFQWICLNWPPRELFFHKVMNFQKYMLNFSNTKDRPFSNASSLDTQKDKRTKDRPFSDTSSFDNQKDKRTKDRPFSNTSSLDNQKIKFFQKSYLRFFIFLEQFWIFSEYNT